MLDPTPQERMALTCLAILLVAGAGARHVASRAEARPWLEYSAEAADTLDPARGGVLREVAERELDLERIRATPLAAGERIDPNTAPAEQLDRLPRIGPALAERIVAHRQLHGPFRTLADLEAVSGIGPALLEAVAPHLQLSGSAGGSGLRAADSRIDVNRASARELQSLPGIGPALAERIVADREANGRFRGPEDLDRVSGIGPGLLSRIQGAVRFGP